jgi:hypothetical protein
MELFGNGTGRKRRPGYIPLFDDATLADERVAEDAVTEQERNSVLQSVGELTGGTLSRIGDALSIPGDLTRGVLTGQPGERVTGRELLRGAGLVGPEDNWSSFFAGLGTDVLTDPLSFLSGPAKALNAQGMAAKKAGLLDSAATAATRKAIDAGLDNVALPNVAKRNRAALESTGRNITTFDPATVGRPLYGPRTAARDVSLDDLVRYADDQPGAERSLRGVMGDAEFERLRGEAGLSKSFGVGLPFQDPSFVGDAFGKGFGDKYADTLDTLGSMYRWSPVGRTTSALFNNKVDGALNAEDQITNIANFEGRQRLGGIATGAHTYQLSKVASQHPEVFEGEEANRALGRYIEGWSAAQESRPTVMTAADQAYVESRPALKEYADWWINSRQDYLTESKNAGLIANELQDTYGIDYLPRQAEAILDMEGRRNKKVGDAISHMTGDMLGRTKSMQVPGGRDTIIELSRDKMVAGGRRLAKNDDEAAQHILTSLNARLSPGQPAVEFNQARNLARVLNSLPDDVIEKSPLFSQHPTEMIGSYMKGRNEAMATANTLTDSLATMAKNQSFGDVGGGRHISMTEALDRLGLKSYDEAGFDLLDEAGESVRPLRGAANNMRQRLAKIFGGDPDSMKLSEFSVPEEHVSRLLRGRDAFETGEAAQSLLNYLDHYTQAWRGSILTWPSRAVRDLYSGAVSNWLEGAFSPAGVRAARALMQEGPESKVFLDTLRSIPRYASDDGVSQFYADLSQSGLISTTQFNEAGASVLGKGALSSLPGFTPITTGTILSELAPKSGRSWTKFREDFMSWRSQLKPLADTTNPILRAGEQMNTLSDGVNRLSGYIELLRQGYDPQAAARAMKRAHVDYTSLTGFEKAWLKRLFPWYSFQSRIFREVLRQLLEQPGGRYGQLIKGTEAVQDEGGDTYIPSGLRSQFAFPIPEEFGGVPSPNSQAYLTDIDLPGFDQLNMIETPGTAAGTATGTGRQIAMQLHPALRVGVEWAANKDLFTNRPLGESTSSLDAILRSVTGNPNADVPFLPEKIIENTPFLGRPLYAARSLLDTRGDRPLSDRLLTTGFNAVSGIKRRTVAQEDILSDATREIENSIDPYTREFKQVYIPESMQPQVPQWALRRLAVSRALGRERREARKPKKAEKKKKSKSDSGALSLFE